MEGCIYVAQSNAELKRHTACHHASEPRFEDRPQPPAADCGVGLQYSLGDAVPRFSKKPRRKKVGQSAVEAAEEETGAENEKALEEEMQEDACEEVEPDDLEEALGVIADEMELGEGLASPSPFWSPTDNECEEQLEHDQQEPVVPEQVAAILQPAPEEAPVLDPAVQEAAVSPELEAQITQARSKLAKLSSYGGGFTVSGRPVKMYATSKRPTDVQQEVWAAQSDAQKRQIEETRGAERARLRQEIQDMEESLKRRRTS